MDAGAMRNRVAIQVRQDTPDGSGSVTSTWSTIATVWAQVWAASGMERAQRATTEAQVSHRVRMRYYSGLTTAHRLLMSDGRTFNIQFINDTEERHYEMVLDCMEIVGRAAR